MTVECGIWGVAAWRWGRGLFGRSIVSVGFVGWGYGVMGFYSSGG